MAKHITLYLASQSPRRRELLKQVGIDFDVVAVDVDESQKSSENAQDYVIRLASEKAIAGWQQNNQSVVPVLGSDTAVVIQGTILGKPESREDAIRMLNLLSGQTHQVMTAVALLVPSNKKEYELHKALNVSDVTFNVLSEEQIAQYVDSGEGEDKAGSYAIQGKAAAFITHLSGSYSGVMGLPLFETLELLNKASVSRDCK